MYIENTKLDGVKLLTPKINGDHRGWFIESYNKNVLQENGIDIYFIQDNHSYSLEKGTLRGLHYQKEPKAQTKLVRCTKGIIFDVVVDIRVGSPTYGQWIGIELSAENKKQVLIPKGFAHGFITVTEDVEVQYKVDEYYSSEHDRSILWKDKTINVSWPEELAPILSEKDLNAPSFIESDNNFLYKEILN